MPPFKMPPLPNGWQGGKGQTLKKWGRLRLVDRGDRGKDG